MGKHRQTTNVAGAENGEELSKFRNIIVTVLKGNDTSDAKKTDLIFVFGCRDIPADIYLFFPFCG